MHAQDHVVDACRAAQEMVQSQSLAVGKQHRMFQDHACALQLSWGPDPLWGPAQLPPPASAPLP